MAAPTRPKRRWAGEESLGRGSRGLVAGADPEQNLTGGTTFDWGPFFCELGEFKQFYFIIYINIK
jgi:hypothetical protein